MSRNDYRVGEGEMKNNGKQNQMVRNAAREVGASEMKLSQVVHEEKGTWDSGDFSYSELLELAREIKAGKR